MPATATTKYYRRDIDLLKGIAILAVVIYHLGISPAGYLGVDVFFVINGFFILPKVVHDVQDNTFHYFSFLEKRIIRLLPLLLLVTFITLLVGWYGMLPDDYENLSESVIATNFFSNNILAAVTTKNYWDVVNEYKPLMHTWYIGILMEFYLTVPLIIMVVKWLSKKFHLHFQKYIIITLISLSVISILLYVNPSIIASDKFYLLPYRFYELASGGLAGIWITNYRQGRLCKNGILSGIGFILLIFIIFAGIFYIGTNEVQYNLASGAVVGKESFIPQNVLLLLTVALTLFFVICDNTQNILIRALLNVNFLCLIGKMSYSIFIWHQPILAFYRYFFANNINLIFIIIFFIVVLALSYLSYRFIELKVKVSSHTRILTLVVFVLINSIAFTIYLHAGVVRDVPELYIQANNAQRGMHSEYVDRIYAYDKDFPANNDKINILVVGNSFARDWGNILLESKMADKINLSYLFEFKTSRIKRIKSADYIFIHDWKHNIPYYVWENIKPNTHVWGIGTKNFGESNGIFYKNRHKPDFYEQTVKINPNFFLINDQLKREWKDQYIDLIHLVLNSDSTVPVFSKKHKFLSQDTRHLTKGGAEFYANNINFDKIFKEKENSKLGQEK